MDTLATLALALDEETDFFDDLTDEVKEVFDDCDDFKTTFLLDLTDCDSDETFVEMLDFCDDTGW